ncbi:MAG TPA: serine/threonine protein kinase [Pyrinomonadaceae bacterium]|nr:serine/threonine protein kinase [Pyrinomonadaceae bacterium]
MKELSLNNSRLDGRYEIRNELGRGSYAEIFVARDAMALPDSPHVFVVIKALNVFLQNDLDHDLERTLVENFQNEAIALDRVRHPNIISRLGHGTARDLRNTVFHYLVLEYLPGGDLARACREKSLNLTQALFYIEQVCAGLGHAHKNGIIHRDIKPQNLLLTEDRKTAKIADFGVARMSQEVDTPITRVGTNMFAPPEHSPMLSGQTGTLAFSELTPAADIYSLAKSAYVLITCESPRFFANQPITELPFDMRQKPWAKDLIEVLKKATQTDPRQRYQNVNDFWQDLSGIKTLAEAEDGGEDMTRVSDRRNNVPQPHVAAGYTPVAPQIPRFGTTQDLRQNPKLSALANPPLVVKVNEANKIQPPVKTQPEIIENAPVFNDEAIYQTESSASRKSFFRRFAAFALIIGIFAGILYATNVYLRGNRGASSGSGQFKQLTGKANTDVNLRPTPSAAGEPLGVVPKNSRVRVVNSKDNWYEIDIIEFGSPKENSSDAEHGWVNKRYIDVQE